MRFPTIAIFLILPVLLFSISAIPAFAPSHPVGGQTIVDEIDEISPTSTFTCDRDSEGNLISFLAPEGFCGVRDGTINCDNPIDYFHFSVSCDVGDEGNSGQMNMIILIFIIIIVIVIIVISIRRR